MKFHDSMDRNRLCVTGYGRGYITVGEQRIRSTFILTPDRIDTDPGVDSILALAPGALPILATVKPEILLIGTGRAQQMPSPAFIAHLAARRIGVEYMDTFAACRTFNILAAEQRRVAALLFIEE